MQVQGAIISPDTQRSLRVPPGQHLTDRWPVLHYGSVAHISASKWTLKIFGMVEKERTLNYAEFIALPGKSLFRYPLRHYLVQVG